MAEILGLQTIMNSALPTGVDGTRLAKWALRSGMTYEEFARRLATALTDLNQEMVNMWGDLMFLTEEPMFEYPDGGSVTPMPEITDTDIPDARGATTIGHMIELRAYGDRVGGSKRWFRDARQTQINAEVRRVVNSGKWRFEQTLLNRIFLPTEYQVGTSGYNVPFVHGTSGNVDFAPPAYGGEAFTTSHDHYVGVDSGSYGYDYTLNSLAEHLQEHGHEPPFIAYVSRANVGSYSVLPSFVNPLGGTPIMIVESGGIASNINRYFSQDMREFGRIGGFHSDYGYVELRASNRIPSGYMSMHKSYGRLDQRNSIAVRVHPDVGFGFYIVPETVVDNKYPLKSLQIEFEAGIGVGEDRTNGVAGYLVAGGTWANPTIT